MTLENTVFSLKTLNNNVMTIFMFTCKESSIQTVLSQVICEGLWGTQEIAWSQHDFKAGRSGPALRLVAGLLWSELQECYC